jgi:hypothetical protein
MLLYGYLLAGLRKTRKCCLCSRSPGRDLNPGPAEYEVRMLPTRQQYSPQLCTVNLHHTYLSCRPIVRTLSIFYVRLCIYSNRYNNVTSFCRSNAAREFDPWGQNTGPYRNCDFCTVLCVTAKGGLSEIENVWKQTLGRALEAVRDNEIITNCMICIRPHPH